MPEPVNAHSLTLKFHRFLSQDEWRKVARAVDLFVPFVQEMDANAVTETAEELARVRIQPSSARAPSQASEPQDPRFKYILEAIARSTAITSWARSRRRRVRGAAGSASSWSSRAGRAAGAGTSDDGDDNVRGVRVLEDAVEASGAVPSLSAHRWWCPSRTRR